MENDLSLERLFEIVGEFNVALVVNAFVGRNGERLLDAVDAFFRQTDGFRFEIDILIAIFSQNPNDLRKLRIAVRRLVRRA